MKSIKLLPFIFILLFLKSFSQNCNTDQWLEKYKMELGQELIDSSNVSEFDFSDILLDQRSNYIGFIGENKKRLHITFESITKKDNNQYKVIGSTTVGQNTRNFEGNIGIKQICSFKDFNYGVDDWMKGKVNDQGILIGEFTFSENSNYSATGVFKGVFVTRWYLNLDGHLTYDNIDSDSDSYSNNQFLGTWTSYKTNKISQCAWGHYKIPCAGDLDIGAAEFSPNDKYFNFGWKNYSNK